MTDPNYWLAAWLAVMAVIFIPAVINMVTRKKHYETLFGCFVILVN